jgi:prepilin-type N-terminal cleavage/methylation domain-containing protein
MSKLQRQDGFTILELMIATMVFSTVLLGATTALIQIGKLYYKGVVSNRTQEVTRGLVDQIGQQLQFSGGKVTPAVVADYSGIAGAPNNTLKFGVVCIGTTRYTYSLNVSVYSSTSLADNTYLAESNQLHHALWRDTLPSNQSCTAVNLSLATPTASGEEMLGENMRLSDFTVSCGANNMCNVAVAVLYGPNDLMAPTPTTDPMNPVATHCASVAGSQWCTASQFSTTVFKRVEDK